MALMREAGTGHASLLRDLSFPAIAAGFIAVVVGFTSSAVIVFEAARALGASPAHISSWLLALGLGLGVTCIGLSLRNRMPVLTAWSTPGAAMLAVSVSTSTLNEATGAFIFAALLTMVAGFSGVFERLMQRLPRSLAAGMLAGVLLRFGTEVFVAIPRQPVLVLGMIGSYLLGRRLFPRYVVIGTLVAGLAIAAASGLVAPGGIRLEAPNVIFTMPAWSWSAVLGIGLPLFIVTMTSQNIPGVAVLHAHGYRPPLSPAVGSIGVVNALLAPFGAFAINLAALTAAICAAETVDRDPARRYTAGVAAGVFYLLMGAFAATLVAFFAAMPRELVIVVGGLALLGTITSSLQMALADDTQREAAVITFLIAASGMSLWGIGSAFWALLAGLAVMVALNASGIKRRRR